jgi:hypothetical protein
MAADTTGVGYNVYGDVLVNLTADGVDLNQLWGEIRDALALYNDHRSAIVRLLSYPTTAVADVIPQTLQGDSFEEATEFGVPMALREPADYLRLGYNFKDYDKSLRATWKWLRGATAEQVTAQVTRIFEADNRLVTGTILRRLLNPATETNEWQYLCYGLWNADGMVPPPYLGKTFDGTHTHYITSGSPTLDSADMEDMRNHVLEHGYGRVGVYGGQMLAFLNPVDFNASEITTWRAGVDYGGPSVPKYDFIPSSLQPAYLTIEHLVGMLPPPDFNGLQVQGAYGDVWLVETNYIPPGYVAMVATGGPESDMNPVGFRQHVNPAYQGLRHIPGPGPYPLQDSFYARGFGVGVRHRGAAVALQVTTNTSYAAPPASAILT